MLILDQLKFPFD